MKSWIPEDRGTFRILLIDDDFDVVQVTLAVLAPLNLECYYALDGPSALEDLARLDPHLVLLDLEMPEMSGLEVLARIRTTSYIPVLVVTSHPESEEALQAFKAGADDFVHKPFDPKLLTARVVAQLRRAYRYNRTEVIAEHEAPSDAAGTGNDTEPGTPVQVPPGWVLCGRCGYMGPFERFEYETALGQRSMLCPNCKEEDDIIFSVT